MNVNNVNTISQDDKEPGGISFFDIIFELRQNIVMILVTIFICLSLSVVYTQYIQVEEYSSTSSVMLYAAADTASSSQIQYSIMVMQTYREFVTSRAITKIVLQTRYNQYGALKNRHYSVSVNFTSQSLMAYITVKSNVRDEAWQLADMYARVSSAEANDGDTYPALRGAKISVVDSCDSSNVSSTRHLSRNLLVGMGMGIVIAAAYILIKLLFDNTFTKIDDVERTLGLTVLASIPKVDIDSIDFDNIKPKKKIFRP